MDKRVERTRAVVLEATIKVLGAAGYEAFSMEAVAQSAGIAKSTLYRHWPTKIGLVTDALETLNQQPDKHLPAEPMSYRTHIVDLLTHLAEALTSSRIAPCIPALIEAAERHAEVAAFLHDYSANRRQALERAIQQGLEAGEFNAFVDAKLAALALSGAIFYRRLMAPDPFEADQIPALVTMVLGREPKPR